MSNLTVSVFYVTIMEQQSSCLPLMNISNPLTRHNKFSRKSFSFFRTHDLWYQPPKTQPMGLEWKQSL